MKSRKLLEEVQLGVMTLKREAERLPRIAQTLQGLDTSLQQLHVALLQRSIKQRSWSPKPYHSALDTHDSMDERFINWWEV